LRSLERKESSMLRSSKLRFAVFGPFVLGLCLACVWGSEEGERSRTGECPAGEVCSDLTPAGLTFVGQILFDEASSHLGPVLADGTFDLGITSTSGDSLPELGFQIEDPSVLAAVRGEGVFGPTDSSGNPLIFVDDYLTLTGVGEGSTYVRIVDPATGELFDRLLLEVYVVEDIAIRNANDPDREYLLAGCEEMLGVRLVARNGDIRVRAIDQAITMRADGEVSPEPAFWDCFLYTVPEGRAEVVVEVDTAGQTFSRTLSVQTLAEAGVAACPPVARD
jgi:hypothetical protein